MNVGEVLLDQGTEGHGREHLLLQHDRDADHVRLLLLDHGLYQMLEHITVDVHLSIVHCVDHIGRDKDLVGQIRLHRRHADSGRGIDHRDDGCNLWEYINGPLQLIDIIKYFSADDRLGLHSILDQFLDPLVAEIAESHLQIYFSGVQITSLRELAEAVELLRHTAQDFLQEVLAEVPVPHFEVDVFLDDGMAGLTEGGKAEIGFRWEPVRRVDEQHFHLPAAGGFGGFTMEHDQLLRSPLALRIL